MPFFELRMALILICIAGLAPFAALGQGTPPPIPMVIKGLNLPELLGHPVANIRAFSYVKGQWQAVAFQIDEINERLDFVLDKGPNPNHQTGDGQFSSQDELSFMIEDCGFRSLDPILPSHPYKTVVIDIHHDTIPKNEPKVLYLGIYEQAPPPLSTKAYVTFQKDNGKVYSSEYSYEFDPLNYLVVKKIVGLKDQQEIPLVRSSTFYLKADLKYFLTLEIDQKSVLSALEAYKIGPIRAIVRVKFTYTLLKLNFDLGMYTEISFFDNAVILPAVMENPLDGERSFNYGSTFYYGFALEDNPRDMLISTNMNEPPKDLFSPLWLTAEASTYGIFMEVNPSRDMRLSQNFPILYIEHKKAAEIISRGVQAPMPLGLGPVNLALSFDLRRFKRGSHDISFRMYFRNHRDKAFLEALQKPLFHSSFTVPKP